MNQFASKGVTEQIDNLLLQKLLEVIDGVKIEKDKVVFMKLGKCPFCPKQYLSLTTEEEEISGKIKGKAVCLNYSNAIDAKILVYQIDTDEQIICLESEAEELLEKYKQQ